MENPLDIRKAIVDEFLKRLNSEPKFSADAITKLTQLVSSGKKLKPVDFIEIFESAENSND